MNGIQTVYNRLNYYLYSNGFCFWVVLMKWTSIKLSDLMRQKSMRLDARYWIQKALLKKRKKELEKKKKT